MRIPSTCHALTLAAAFALQGCGGGSGGNDDQNNGGATEGPDQIDLPFDYTIGSHTLEITTAGGTVYVSVGAYGAHFHPFSGDLIGDAKSNMMGFFVGDISELHELPGTGGNGNGICEAGESCGFPGGTTGEEIANRIPTYISPLAATLRRVTYNNPPNGFYFGNVPHWEIELQLSDRFTLRIGHLGGIAPGLRDKIHAATGIDTDSYSGPPGHILRNGSISVSKGEELAFPQVFANEIDGYPGYYRGGGSISAVPWAQMEYTISDHLVNADVCVYDLLEPTTKSAIQSAMDNDMANATSPRYMPNISTKWAWGVEGVLCPSYSPKPDDFSSIHTRFGGWTERQEHPGTTIDELFAIVTIIKSSSSYSSSNYEPGVDHLVSRTRPGFPPFSWTMPDNTVVNPFIPVGEVLEETADSLLIKWRDIGWSGPVYQRAKFLLDSERLKIKWGNFAADIGGAIMPDLTSSESCNDSEVICYDHQARL